jgi:hypothetical protein
VLFHVPEVGEFLGFIGIEGKTPSIQAPNKFKKTKKNTAQKVTHYLRDVLKISVFEIK